MLLMIHKLLLLRFLPYSHFIVEMLYSSFLYFMKNKNTAIPFTVPCDFFLWKTYIDLKKNAVLIHVVIHGYSFGKCLYYNLTENWKANIFCRDPL